MALIWFLFGAAYMVLGILAVLAVDDCVGGWLPKWIQGRLVGNLAALLIWPLVCIAVLFAWVWGRRHPARPLRP